MYNISDSDDDNSSSDDEGQSTSSTSSSKAKLSFFEHTNNHRNKQPQQKNSEEDSDQSNSDNEYYEDNYDTDKENKARNQSQTRGSITKLVLNQQLFSATNKNILDIEDLIESGNLAKAVKITSGYYELYLRPDMYTNRHTQWFYFRVSNTRKNVNYR